MTIPTVLADTQVYEAWWIQIIKALVIFIVILFINLWSNRTTKYRKRAEE